MKYDATQSGVVNQHELKVIDEHDQRVVQLQASLIAARTLHESLKKMCNQARYQYQNLL